MRQDGVQQLDQEQLDPNCHTVLPYSHGRLNQTSAGIVLGAGALGMKIHHGIPSRSWTFVSLAAGTRASLMSVPGIELQLTLRTSSTQLKSSKFAGCLRLVCSYYLYACGKLHCSKC
jgi:hypothetical protein